MSMKEVLVKAPKHQPTLSLDEKDLPAIKNWKVGGRYRITIDVEQVSAEKGDSWNSPDDDDSKKLSARFKVLKATEHESEDRD